MHRTQPQAMALSGQTVQTFSFFPEGPQASSGVEGMGKPLYLFWAPILESKVGPPTICFQQRAQGAKARTQDLLLDSVAVAAPLTAVGTLSNSVGSGRWQGVPPTSAHQDRAFSRAGQGAPRV